MTLLALLASPALAHETRQVGSYSVAVGWSHEPAYAGAENGVQIFIHDATGAAVDDLGTPTSLKVQVIYGHQTSPYLDLEPSWDPDTGLGTHGEWDAAITPTQPGVYTFHLTGSIDGQAVDQTFTASDSTFAVVEDPDRDRVPDQDAERGRAGHAPRPGSSPGWKRRRRPPRRPRTRCRPPRPCPSCRW